MAEILQYPGAKLPDLMSWEELISACARDREDYLLWTEFLRRYGPRIRRFIKGALRQALGAIAVGNIEAVLGGLQHSDLFQNAILRLVEDDCAALRRFSGKSEGDWLAYLAVITRSVVRESLRRQRALKRPGGAEAVDLDIHASARIQPGSDPREMERRFLAQEVRKLGERVIHSIPGVTSSRDLLIFQLYFDHDLSFDQISQCQSINISKTGVEKALARMRDLIRSAMSQESSEEMIQ
jgi:RNA polymerase sigma factor (sigma-70 family)